MLKSAQKAGSLWTPDEHGSRSQKICIATKVSTGYRADRPQGKARNADMTKGTDTYGEARVTTPALAETFPLTAISALAGCALYNLKELSRKIACAGEDQN